MTDGAVRWSPAQQSMLRELGCEMFSVREAPSAPAQATAPPLARGRRVLVVLSPEANWLRGPNAKLARGLLAALGVKEDEVRGEPHPGAPALCFGRETPGAVHAPALAMLRDARAKRALWPALRALRRQLGTP